MKIVKDNANQLQTKDASFSLLIFGSLLLLLGLISLFNKLWTLGATITAIGAGLLYMFKIVYCYFDRSRQLLKIETVRVGSKKFVAYPLSQIAKVKLGISQLNKNEVYSLGLLMKDDSEVCLDSYDSSKRVVRLTIAEKIAKFLNVELITEELPHHHIELSEANKQNLSRN